MSSSNTPALQNHYKEQVIPALTKSRGYTNPHQVPSIVKVSINSGFGTDLDKNQIADVIKDLDGQGNYTIGISDYSIFPEISVENVKRSLGFDITIVTTANSDDEGRELLSLLGMPFRRPEPAQAA